VAVYCVVCVFSACFDGIRVFTNTVIGFSYDAKFVTNALMNLFSPPMTGGTYGPVATPTTIAPGPIKAPDVS